MPKSPQPKLTKAELAALDYLIADAKERPESGLITAQFWTVFVREALTMLVRQAIRTRLQRTLMNDLGPLRKAVSESQLAELNKHVQETILDAPSLDQLIELRKSLDVRD